MELTLQRERELIVLLSLLDLQASEGSPAVTIQTISADICRRGYWRTGKVKVRIAAALEVLVEDGRVRRVGDRYLLMPAGEGALYGWARFAVRRRNELQKSTSVAVLRMSQLADQLTAVPPAPAGAVHPAGHHVYVVLLAEDVLRKERVLQVNPDREPGYPCVYVGLTGKSPERRFYDHKRGHKSSRWVRRYGIRLLPELMATDPMPYQAALREEGNLAAALRAKSWTVLAGHHDSRPPGQSVP